MAKPHLATYLNDHLAGSVAALALLAHLEKTHAGSTVGDFAAGLRGEIAADRDELESLMKSWEVAESRPRQAAAWLAEKLARLKLRVDDAADGPLHLLEALEAVAVGIEGKRALWRSLVAAAETAPELQGVDYGRLERRADEQRQRVEVVRLQAARAAFGGQHSSDA